MNSLDGDRVYFRSLATRGSREVPEALGDVLTILKAAGFDLVVVETPGIGQGDAAITTFADVNLYVMTPEFGAASQLEKIDMLDFADVVAINKFERRGAMDALRDVGRQMVRNRGAFGKKPDDMPVFGTVGRHLQRRRRHRPLPGAARPARRGRPRGVRGRARRRSPCGTRRCCARSCPRSGCATSPRSPRRCAATTTTPAGTPRPPAACSGSPRSVPTSRGPAPTAPASTRCSTARRTTCRSRSSRQLAGWSSVVEAYSGDEQVITVRDKEIHTSLVRESLSGNRIRRVSLPRYSDDGDLVSFLRRENLPGYFPFTAGRLPVQARQRGPRAGCSPARATRSAPTAASRCSRRASPPPGSRPPSTRSPSTAATPTSAPTSTARSAPRASRSPPSTTCASCTPASTSPRPPPASR